MEKYEPKTTRKFRGSSVSDIAIGSTYELAARWPDLLRKFSPRAIARRIGASPRTVENWQDGVNGPTWKHTVAMLNDDELCAKLLEAAGRPDLAHAQEVLATRKKLKELEGK
ncbi:hypothetical protein [Reyranella sp.]|uniref:hypothetical protein n=1 Tax=Reyranella sp. TaxID=1929291 RepID=UPI00121779FA|nr:hypothetical protein [Reyranella sp.]TAJ89707.1 MAG: hypothetical protein EPO50_04910 [Reyranella sp.]